jgi:arginine/lysine/ornithine decarboxylase
LVLLYAFSGSFEILGKQIDEKDVVILDNINELHDLHTKATVTCQIAVAEVWNADKSYWLLD